MADGPCFFFQGNREVLTTGIHPLALIVALLPQVALNLRLRAAVRGHHEIIGCADWSDVFAECSSRPVQIAVIDLYADGRAQFDQVRNLRSFNQRLTLIAYVVATPDRAHDLFDAGRYGFDGLIVADKDDTPTAILAEISQAESRGVIADVRRIFGESLSVAARDALLLAVSRAHERLSPAEFARVLRISKRQLGRTLKEAGLPAPARLLTWGRLVVAAFLLEDATHNADKVARLLRFPSGSAFRNTCRRYLGAAPGELRSHGVSRVMEALRRESKVS